MAKKEKAIKETNKQDINSDVSAIKPLEFGTAGIRGIMGQGIDKINPNTISAAAYAYGKYLIENVKGAKKRGVVIGHDNRKNSSLFALLTAQVIQKLGIKTHLYQDNKLQPTPFLSYTIRKLNLIGGVMITASHNPKEYNGFKVYDEFGGQLLPSETKKIQKIMSSVSYSSIRYSNLRIPYIKSSLENRYMREVLKLRLRPNDQKQIKVIFSPQHGTAAMLGTTLLANMDVEYYAVEKQMSPDPSFSNTKTPNPEDPKSLVAAISLAKKKKADLVLTTDPDADRIGVAVKHQKRFKYLNGNHIAALYLNYMIEQMKKQKGIPKNSYIVTSIVSGMLAQEIAKRHGIKVYHTHVGFKNIAKVIEENKEENFLFAYEESYGFLINPNISRDKDALQGLVGIVEMANYYKTQSSNLYMELKKLHKSYKLHRTIQMSKVLTEGQSTRLMNRIMKLQNIGDKKVIKREDYRKGRINKLSTSKMVKIYLEGGSWLAIRPSGTEPKVKIYIQSIGSREDNIVDVSIYEKVIENAINNEAEINDIKTFKWKTVIKYSTFIAIVVGILYFVFAKVYKDIGGSTSLFNTAMLTFNASPSKSIWALWLYSTLFTKTIAAYVRWRMIRKLGGQARMGDLYIANILGTFVSYVTPLTIGGDAIVYWYLRRRGVARGPLLSSLMTATMIHQINTVLETIVLFAIGWPVYREILFSGADSNQFAASVMFMSGLAWSLFSAIMILSITIIKPFQEFIIRNSVKLAEWAPFIQISDPGKTSSRYLYELKVMRDGIKVLWRDKLLYAEVTLLMLLPALLSFSEIGISLLGWTREDLPRPAYISQIVANDVIRTANSWSLTPGGSGTGEWLVVHVKNFIYDPAKVGDGSIFTTGAQVSSAMDILWKTMITWPWIIISLGTIFTVLIGEYKKHNYDIKVKNLTLSGQKKVAKKLKFRFYGYAYTGWLFALSGYITFWMLF